MVMSIKWGEEYWSLRPCSMSLVSLCQLWRLRPCRSWPRSGLHVLEPPSWLVPSESYQAVLPTGPTFPCSRPVEPGLRMPGGDLNADLKRTLSGQLLPRGRIAWREEDAFVWPPLLRVRLREWRRLDLRTSPSAAAPPPPAPHLAQVPLRSARSAQPSPVAPNSAILFICTQGAPPLLDVQGFDPFTTFMSLSPLSSYT